MRPASKPRPGLTGTGYNFGAPDCRARRRQYPSFALSLNLPSTSCPILCTWPSDSFIVSAAARFFTPFLARQALTVTVLPTLSVKSFLWVPLLFKVERDTVSKDHEVTSPL